MQNLRLEMVERSTSLGLRPVGIGLYVVDEAIRGVVPPTEWMHPAFKEWLPAFVGRLHARFVHALPPEPARRGRRLDGAPAAQEVG